MLLFFVMLLGNILSFVLSYTLLASQFGVISIFSWVCSAVFGWVLFFVHGYHRVFLDDLHTCYVHIQSKLRFRALLHEHPRESTVGYVLRNLDKFGVRDSGGSSLDDQEIFSVPPEVMGF